MCSFAICSFCLTLPLFLCVPHPIPETMYRHETVLSVDPTACSISSHGAWIFVPSAYICVCFGALSWSCVTLSAVYKEMLIWIACRGQCHGCRSNSSPSPWSSLPVNIITTHWKHTHSQQACIHTHTQTTHTHKLLIQIGANRLAVIINKHGGLILFALSLLFHWASQGNYQVLDC